MADRLNMLVEQGIVTRAGDPTHGQKAVYSLTDERIRLLPILAQIDIWSRRYLPVKEELGATAGQLALGGPPLWKQLMGELRAAHLSEPQAQPATT